jgi:hypothetical protein
MLPSSDVSPGHDLPPRFSTERESQLADIAQPLFNRALRDDSCAGSQTASIGKAPALTIFELRFLHVKAWTGLT